MTPSRFHRHGAPIAHDSGRSSERPTVRLAMKRDDDADIEAMHAALDRLAMRPPKKCIRSPQEQAEHEATEAVKLALELDGESQRSLANRVHRDEKLVREWVSGSRAAPVWLFFRLRRDGQMALLRVLMAAVRKEDEPFEEDDPDSKRGAA